jgi:hypothetical protein
MSNSLSLSFSPYFSIVLSFCHCPPFLCPFVLFIPSLSLSHSLTALSPCTIHSHVLYKELLRNITDTAIFEGSAFPWQAWKCLVRVRLCLQVSLLAYVADIFLFGLPFDPVNGSYMLLRNVGLSPNYIRPFSCSCC